MRLPRRALAAPLVLHEQRGARRHRRASEPTGCRSAGARRRRRDRPSATRGRGRSCPGSKDARVWPSPVQSVRAGPSPSPRRCSRCMSPLPRTTPSIRFAACRSPGARTAVAGRFESLRGRVADATLTRARDLWDAALDAPAWSKPPVWIHGDLHPGNLVARGSELVAIIDFGDVTAGDPAYDLAVAWLAFDAARALGVHRIDRRPLRRRHMDAGAWVGGGGDAHAAGSERRQPRVRGARRRRAHRAVVLGRAAAVTLLRRSPRSTPP